jgi:hypothetical protein
MAFDGVQGFCWMKDQEAVCSAKHDRAPLIRKRVPRLWMAIDLSSRPYWRDLTGHAHKSSDPESTLRQAQDGWPTAL